jgi:hypothetical protein
VYATSLLVKPVSLALALALALALVPSFALIGRLPMANAVSGTAVQYYGPTSATECYTDFHVDFG